jgi:uncharacterized protein YecA (UPF0149 family)
MSAAVKTINETPAFRGVQKVGVILDEASFKLKEPKKKILVVDDQDMVTYAMLRNASNAELKDFDLVKKKDLPQFLIDNPAMKDKVRVLTKKGITLVKFNKTKRNDPCPCKSGKKYKKCCLIGVNADPGS